MKRVPTQDCLRKSFNTHLRKMLTRRLRPKQNSLRDFSTVPFLYKPNHLQKNVAHMAKDILIFRLLTDGLIPLKGRFQVSSFCCKIPWN